MLRDAAAMGVLVQDAGFAYASTDLQGRLQVANRVWLRTFRLDAADVDALVPFDGFLTPTSAGYIREALRSGDLEHGLTDHELVFVRKDGTTFEALLAVTRAPGHAEHDLGLLRLVLIDLSSLREKESQFRQLLDSAPDALVIVDSAGRIRHVNVQTERLFGYRRVELIGRRVEVLIPERFHAGHEQHRSRYVDAPSPRFMGTGRELNAVRRDGSEFPVEVSLSPLRTPDGLLISAAMRDVTERKRTEAIARTAMERLVSAVESIPQPFAIFDASDRLVSCNSAFRYSLTASIQGPVLDLPFEDLLDAAIVAGVYDLNGTDPERFKRDRLAYRSAPTGAFETKTQEGRHWRIIDRRTPEGGTVTTIWDLTDDVKKNEELAEARAAAEAASAAKSEFLSSVSHELRTPLNAILGFSQLLQRDKQHPLTDRQLGMLAHVIKGGEHLLRLIDEILDLSRVESGNVLMSPEPVNIQDLFGELKSTLAPVAARAGIDLDVAPVPDDLPPVFADRTRLAQILMNFGSNALKYGRAGGRAELKATQPNPERVRLIVSDTGLGIPADQQSKMFQPFHRAGQETGPIEGTGIGLTISKRLAEMMGGGVGFRSTEGQGSDFWVELDAHLTADSTSLPPKASLRRNDALLDRDGPHYTVLYIEDNPSNLAFMEALFATIDRVSLLKAATAEIGIELARAHRPNLIILDINLPGMSGFEALRHIKGFPETRDTPVFALSASAMDRDLKRAQAAGFSAYLTKPIQVDELLGAVTRVLEGAG